MQKLNQANKKQKGAALIIFAVIFALAATAFLVSQLDGSGVKIEREKKTVAALAEAKAALIGFAARSGVLTGQARPGDLPCPDTNEDGSSDPCPGDVIGRLPWRTLGLSDLRDGDGERLWYAVSSTFKNSPRTLILNSDTFGTITLRDATGTILNNENLESPAIAVVIAPGNPLTRTDGIVQSRTMANHNIAIHYLDNFDSADNSKDDDNGDFVGSSINGFVNGVIKDATDNVIVNDRIVAVNYNDLMPLLNKRVANEVKKRLNNIGGLPWAAPFTNPALSNNNFVPVNNTNGGLLPAYPHFWDIIDTNPLNPPSVYVTRSGSVTEAELTSGFVEPGFCSQVGAQIDCTGRKQLVEGANLIWRNQSINIMATLNANNSFPSNPMVGTLTVTETRVLDGAVLGTGSVAPTPTTRISILPTRSTLFPEWLTANNWHHMTYYAIATPYVYSAPLPLACGACLSVNYNGGLMSNIGSAVMVAGKRLDATDFQPATPQNRPSNNLYDYYDSINNQVGGATFDWNRALTPTFNDQLVIVAP
jgi:hypothetical protein